MAPLVALLVALAAVASPASEAWAKTRSKSRAAGGSVAASIVVDMNTGRVLQSQNPETPRQPASLTKMMTLYMLFSSLRSGAVSLDSDLVVTPYAASQSPTKLGLKPGTTIRTRDAVYALVTLSANDAAVAIAENLGGTEQNFARAMTQKARTLGMSGTTFYNASGLPNDGQITTARDMAVLAQHLIHDFPEFYGCFRSKYFTYAGRRYRNHNHLLFNYAGTDGIKTGYTRAAGFNLTVSVHRDNKHLVAVVLGGKTSAQRDAAMRSLLDANFSKAKAGQPAEPVVAARPAPAPAVASLEREPPVAAPKKQVFALADAGSGVDVPTFGRQDAASGDAEDEAPAPVPAAAQGKLSVKVVKVVAVQPAKPPTAKAPTGKSDKAPSGASGPFHVQVGAYTTQEEAESRLGTVSDGARNLLAGHPPLSVAFLKDDTQWYRARFAGFSQGGARSTCEQLKRLSFDCVVMRAN